MVWILSHQGILGNELVDKKAKKATTVDNIDNLYKWLPSEKRIKSSINKFWDAFGKSGNGTFLTRVRKSILDSSPVPQTNRKDQTGITRMRKSHTNLTHIYKITKG